MDAVERNGVAVQTADGDAGHEDVERRMAAIIAKTMWSPWKTRVPPAITVRLEPVRDIRKLMIQVKNCSS